MRWLVFIWILGSCSFEGPSSTIDGSPEEVDSSPRQDASDATQGLGPWSTPTALPSLEESGGAARYDDPYVVDSSRIYWSINPTGADKEHIFVADFDIASGVATNAIALAEIEQSTGENIPVVNDADTEMLFSVFIGDYLDLYATRRASPADPWGAPTSDEFVALNMLTTHEAPGNLTGNELIYTSNQGGTSDIMIAIRPATGFPFGAGVGLVNHSLPSIHEYGGHLSNKGLRLAYSAKPNGEMNDSIDVFISERRDLLDEFPPGTAVAELNSTSEDSDLWISDDGRTALFASDRSGRFQIYISRRAAL